MLSVKEIDIRTRSERSLFIDRFAQFIKTDSEIEKVADLLIKNWDTLKLEKSKNNYINNFPLFQNKDFDSFCSYLKERFKNNSKNKELEVTDDKTNKLFYPYQRKKLSKLFNLDGFNRMRSGMIAQFPNDTLLKDRLIKSLKSEFDIDGDSFLFNFNLFYSDSELKLIESSFPFGMIKIKVLFRFKAENKSSYLNWEFDDFRLYLIESIRDAMSSKFQELMSEQWSVQDLMNSNCNSLFVTDENFLEFFQKETGVSSKQVIDYLNGEERNRILNLFQEFFKS